MGRHKACWKKGLSWVCHLPCCGRMRCHINFITEFLLHSHYQAVQHLGLPAMEPCAAAARPAVTCETRILIAASS